MVPVECLFALIRYALGKQSTEDAALLARLRAEEWAAVYDLTIQQNVMAIAFDGLSTLVEREPASCLAGKQVDERAWGRFVRAWGANVLYQEQRYEDYAQTVGQLARFYAEHGLRMMVLKGYGLSLDWPLPNHRPCGDIDIFLLDEDVDEDVDRLLDANVDANGNDDDEQLSPWKKGDEEIEKLGIKVEKGDSHHSRFCYQGWSVENHHSFMEQTSYRSNRTFEKELQQLTEEDREEIEIDGVKFDIPAPTLMALHLTRHAGCDFASNTILLRQLLDWALFVDKRSAEMNWVCVTDIIDRMGMRGFFDMMNDLSVNELGISKDKFPSFKEDAKLRKCAIHDMFYSPRVNDFPNHHKKFIYGLKKTRQAWNNRWKNRLVFNEGFLSLYWQKAMNRLKN